MYSFGKIETQIVCNARDKKATKVIISLTIIAGFNIPLAII